ncbi:hypothetical protein [Priestia taiwanensis]|uniref:VCBS repeat-containing protein n=1 Tax=Priestia taiwanensis TaxID=1347902 RepID=A0A917EQX7_9BACI|nr:hypothetical protein [Priestia taiwanensis]MBM7364312.1 bifunctional DNA-binding transcriptional regulator/antitoxin component of YhaV-PrlF toxin-antitoxin module [Priestia taiwanensis]GGE73444.1 hypothetical protein GCM10007140_24120 [Priestia taiwanensis]
MLRKTILLCSALLLLSGCEMFNTPLNTLQPPKLTEKQEKIKEDILKQLPPNSKIADPIQTGQSLPLYNMVDLNGDGKEEVVVFHLTPQQQAYSFSIFKEIGTHWTKVSTLNIATKNIDKVLFKDITDDGNNDIILGIGEETRSKNVFVYQLIDDQIHTVLNAPYEELIVEDMDNDGNTELYTLAIQPKQNKDIEKRRRKSMFLNKYSFVNNSLQIYHQLPIHNDKNAYYFLESGTIAPDKKGILLYTYELADPVRNLNIYYEQNEKLVAIPNQSLQMFQQKPFSTESRDINNDGIMELSIPMLKDEHTAEQYLTNQLPFITGYYQWDGKDEFRLIERHYYDTNLSYDFTIPKEWPTNLKLTRKDNSIHFVDGRTNKILFDIQAIPIEKWDDNSKQYILKQTSHHVFVSTFQTDTYQKFFHIQE